jgi:hypothetical protein
MRDTDAVAAQLICESIGDVCDQIAADEATITTALVLALARRLAGQARTRYSARVGLDMVAEHLTAVVEIYMSRKLGPLI